MSALTDELRTAVALELASLHKKLDQLAAELSRRAERITLQQYRGGSVRANAAFERRHPDLTALAKVIGRRRHYLPSDLDAYFDKGANP